MQTKLANKNLYNTNIDGIRLRLPELQKANQEAQKLKAIEKL